MLNWDRLRACGIDTGAGMACCAEDGEFYAEMLGEFVRDAAAKLGELERFCAARDWDNYRIRAHSLKSTSRTIGATALSQRAKALEDAAKAGDADAVLAAHGAFLADLGALVGAVRAALD